VTTDKVAIRQKRKPILKFKQRLAVVQSCQYVDIAVPHHGLSKEEDFSRLGFNLLISSAEYKNSDEFKDFTACPVIFFPRNVNTSSSNILSDIHKGILEDMTVICYGVNGLVFKLGSYIVKEIRINQLERGTTADVHNLGFPRPRNWKRRGVKHEHPNIPGVNPNRECKVVLLCKHFQWNPVIDVVRKYTEQQTSTISDHPTEIYWIIQDNAGETLEKIWKSTTDEMKAAINAQVKMICKDLKIMGIVHGDIHAGNLCLKDGVVRLIDFGWAMHHSFSMCEKEKSLLKTRLENDFDWKHYTDSIEWLLDQ